jgi:hypothetical protein
MGLLSRSLIVALSLTVITPRVCSGADISIIHGINGRDLGASEELPVDVSINDSCVLRRVAFKNSSTIELGAGYYTVRVFGSSTSGCSGTAVIERTVTIPDHIEHLSFSLVASLSLSGTPQLALFPNVGGVAGTGPGVTIRHVAKAGGLHARVELPAEESNGRSTSIALGMVNNGEEAGYSAAYVGTARGEVGRRYRVALRSGRGVRTEGRRPSVVVGGKFTSTRRILYVVGSNATGLTVIGQRVRVPHRSAPLCTPTPSSVPTSNTQTGATATPMMTPTFSPTVGVTSTPSATPTAMIVTPTPDDTPISMTFPYCAKLGEGRKENGQALPGYYCVGNDPCASCRVICGHPSSVVNATATGATWIEQYNAARSRFPGKMPEWPGGGTNYKPGDATLDKACNLAGYREHVSSTTNTWSSPGDNYLIYWDSAHKKFVKANGATQGGRWAGSIRCKGLLHPSCRGPSNLGWVFQ